ncbi:MAG: serine hydrolase [Candidatus Heimdallarchaeota archaeon]|nr:serine hydrolase [Candidatus Heimdallarchaeota archaeon]MBY8995813.1 serine hydrolase [Candidatus Heimdallarchaeota archaeon]
MSTKKINIVLVFFITGTALIIFNNVSNIGLVSRNNSFYDYDTSRITDLSRNAENSLSTLDISNQTELEIFLDDYIPDQLTQHNIVGMTISFVKDDELLLAKGYGNRALVPVVKPVIANQTLFRIGSISKTFTTVAVLQLVENGILNLDTNINNYLTAFKIPDTYSNPITLRHILTHSAGFEEKAYPSIFSSAFGIPSLEEFVIEILPDRVHPPGVITSYSNYGFTLAGYIVQEMSEKPFEQYIEDEIFIPIGLNSSTFREPLPADLSLNMSSGYNEAGQIGYFEYLSVPPAGSCSSTATNMAKFMIALLDNGYYNGTQILLNETVQMMQEEHFTTHPNLPGANLGLYEMDTHNEHIMGHGGDTIFFHSLMALFPDDKLGFFISYNSRGGSRARDDFFNDFMNRYYPYINEINPMDGYDKGLRQFTGLYCTTRRLYSDKTIQPPIGLPYEIIEHDYLTDAISIATNNGYLEIFGLQFVQIEPDYFVETTGQYDYRIAFIRNENGRITNFYSTIFIPLYSFERLHPIYTTPEGLNFFLFSVMVISLIVSIVWGILALIRIKKGEDKNAILPTISKWLNFGVIIFSIVPFIFVITKNYSTILLAQDAFDGLNSLIILPIIALILIAGMTIFSILSWLGIGNIHKKPYWKLWERILYSVLTILSFSIVAYFMYWNILGY